MCNFQGFVFAVIFVKSNTNSDAYLKIGADKNSTSVIIPDAKSLSALFTLPLPPGRLRVAGTGYVTV